MSGPGHVRLLRPGEKISSRVVYRWLREARRMSCGQNLYLDIRWLDPYPGQPFESIEENSDYLDRTIPESVLDALWSLDAYCKLLDQRRGLWSLRTRYWTGRQPERDDKGDWCRGRYRRPRNGWGTSNSPRRYHDRHRGLWYARKLAAVLRAAHRVGFPMVVQVDVTHVLRSRTVPGLLG